MTWLKKGNRRYYYRSVRRRDQVHSQYVGNGLHAEVVARLDQLEQQQRQEKRRAFQRMVAEQKAFDQEIAALNDQVRSLLHLVLLANGYHKHKRQWRRERMAEEATAAMREDPTKDMSVDELNALIRTVDGKQATAEQRVQLLHYLNQWPKLAQQQGRATEAVIVRLNKSLYGSTTGAAAMAVGVNIDNIKRDLGYNSAPELERLLIQHIIVCWMRWQHVEWNYQNKIEGDHSINERDYWERRLSATQQRYLRALEALTRVRKMNVHLQVNIAQQQIVNRG